MAKYHGKDSYFAIEDSGATTLRDVGQYCDSIDFGRETALAKSTTIGLEDETYLSGLSGATISLAGKWDDAATTGPHAVLNSLVGLDLSVGFEFGPAGNGTGKAKLSGECFLESYATSAPLEDVVKFTASLRITGAVTTGTFT